MAVEAPRVSSPGARVRRLGWFVVGWCAVAIGSVGIVVPGLPTTVFFIAAAWCFARSSPRFEQWILDLPGIGPMVRDHRAGLGMPRRAKVLAVAMIILFAGMAVVLTRDRIVVAAVIAAAGLCGIAYMLWRLPTKEQVPADGASS